MTAVQDLETAIGEHQRSGQSFEARREETGLTQLVFEVGSGIHGLGAKEPLIKSRVAATAKLPIGKF